MPTFLLEDGTGVEGATAYISEAAADDFLADNATWIALATAAKETAIMEASKYVDIRFGNKFKGRPYLSTQGLEFPRSAAYDRYGRLIEGIPDDFANAIALYASYYNAGTLYASDTTSAKEVKRTKTVVGPITTEKEFVGVARATGFLPFPKADPLMASYLIGNGRGGRVIRA